MTQFIPGFFYEIHKFTSIEDILIYNRIKEWFGLFLFLIFFILVVLILDVAYKNIYCKGIFSAQLKKNLDFMPYVILVNFFVSGVLYLVVPQNFRYLEDGLSESSSFGSLIVFTILPSFNKFFLFYHIFLGKFPFNGHTYLKYLVVMSLFFTANGTNTFIVFLIGLMYVTVPKVLKGAIFIRKNSLKNFLVKPMLLLAVILLVVYPLALIYGYSMKTGKTYSEASESFRLDNSEDVVNLQYEFGILRFNQYYISSKTAFYNYFFDFKLEKHADYISDLATNVYYRFVKIVGLDVDVKKPEFSSASQINFSHIAPYSSKREGTSTGLFGGFFYFFPTPLNVMILLMYTSFLMVVVNNIHKNINNKLSLFGMLIFLYWIFPLFEGPIDFLLIFDDTFLILVLYIIYFF